MYLFIAWSNHHASPEFLLNVMELPEIIHAAAGRHAPAVCKLTATGEAHAPEYSGMPKGGTATDDVYTIPKQCFSRHSNGPTGIDISAGCSGGASIRCVTGTGNGPQDRLKRF
jgi:hypothetical protein